MRCLAVALALGLIVLGLVRSQADGGPREQAYREAPRQKVTRFLEAWADRDIGAICRESIAPRDALYESRMDVCQRDTERIFERDADPRTSPVVRALLNTWRPGRILSFTPTPEGNVVEVTQPRPPASVLSEGLRQLRRRSGKDARRARSVLEQRSRGTACAVIRYSILGSAVDAAVLCPR